MSRITLSGNASGTGNFTLASPNSNTDRTLTLPDATGTVVLNEGSGAFKIASSGNVGIGTTNPGSVLEIFGPSSSLTTGNLALNTSSTSGASRISFKESGSTVGQLAYSHDGNNLELIANESGSGIIFYTSGTNQRLRIDSSGLLVSPPTYSNTSGGAANVGIGGSGEFFRSTSSLKYKRDVQDATHGLTELMALRSVTYKGQAQSDGDTIYGGLIAEEVHDAGLTEFVQYAEDGSPDAISYGNMVSLCIKAIQEQQATITALEARITALEAN